MAINPPNGSTQRSAQFPSQLPVAEEVSFHAPTGAPNLKLTPVASNTFELKCRQTAELYLAMPSSMLLSFIGTLFTFLMLYSTGDAQRGVYWLAFATGIVLYRAAVYWQYTEYSPHHTQLHNTNNTHRTNPDAWMYLMFIGNVLAGIQWGLLGTWLYVADPIYRALFSVVVIMGFVGGAVVPYASVRFAHAALAIPATVPPLIYIFFMRPDGNWIVGGIAVFMFGATIYIAEKQYRAIRKRILSEMENEQHRLATEENNTTLGHHVQKLEHRTEVVKRAQLEARRRATTLSQHMETTLLPVIECDLHGRIIEWNHAAEVAFGYRYTDLAAVSMNDLVTAADANVDWKVFFNAILTRKAPAVIDVFMRAADAKPLPVRLYVTPIDIDGHADKKAARAAIIATNITSEIARRRAEKA